MNNYSIGIVVPVYKVRRDYLEYCVRSLICQTYEHIQIVLVDDASPDECGNWCEEISKWDQRIKVVHHEVNKGLPGARNTGVYNLETDYVIFVDSDDWIEKNTCEILNNEINKNRSDIFVYSGFIDNKDNVFKCDFSYDNHVIFTTVQQRTSFESMFLLKPTNAYLTNSFPIQSACCRMISMKLFKEKNLRFTDIRFAEDAIFHLESSEVAESIMYLHYHFYHYRNTDGSMVNSYRPNCDKEQLSFMDALWKFANKYGKSEEFCNQLYYISFMSMQMCIWQKYFNKKNKDSYIVKRKECRKLFTVEPYRSTLNHISFKELTRNQKIKYILMKLTMYASMVKLREKNQSLLGVVPQ